MKRVISVLVLVVLCFTIANASSQNSQTTPQSTATADHAPTPSEIAAAKASHKVWVNLDSGIYHKGGRWYGKTKNGKFMTVDEAKKA
ncbi:MAG: hypothetical protein JOZ80_16135, partial [Acidobacteriaceae bacterium]|nr:hypothetical protein [Acidobacteriaceae bacterium]